MNQSNCRKSLITKILNAHAQVLKKKMAAENTMFLQENMNNDNLQALLVASQQHQHFDIQQFQSMYTQQNTQQSELKKVIVQFLQTPRQQLFWNH